MSKNRKEKPSDYIMQNKRLSKKPAKPTPKKHLNRNAKELIHGRQHKTTN